MNLPRIGKDLSNKINKAYDVMMRNKKSEHLKIRSDILVEIFNFVDCIAKDSRDYF